MSLVCNEQLHTHVALVEENHQRTLVDFELKLQLPTYVVKQHLVIFIEMIT